MIFYAYVGWIDDGEPRVYFTRDLNEAYQGLSRVCIESRAKTPRGREHARLCAHRQVMDKWGAIDTGQS